MDLLLRELYDPASPSYRHFLSPEEFNARFGPTDQDYQAVAAFAEAGQLKVTGTHQSRMLLEVQGRAGDVGKLFHVGLSRRLREDGSEFFAPDAEPVVDLAVPLSHVGGLDSFKRPRPAIRARPVPLPAGSGTHSGLYMGYDFRDAYAVGVAAALNGSGQSIGLFELDTYYPADIASYESHATPALPSNVAVPVPLNGTTLATAPGAYNSEVAMDIEVAISMAPGATIRVYEAPLVSAYSDDVILDAMSTAPLCNQLSASWTGWGDSGSLTYFSKMAAQGQSFFSCSGDWGAYGSGNHYGAAFSPFTLSSYITCVGGTKLTSSATSPPPMVTYLAESTWNDRSGSYGGSSGGGICTAMALPAFQSGVSMAGNGGSTVYRNLPDVSMVANDIVVCYNNGSLGAMEGTSASTPLWAAFMALVNQQAVASGKSVIGSANPAIYAVGKGPYYGYAFHDIADNSSNDDGGLNPTYFRAVTGYDLTTGWGSPKGMSTINALLGMVTPSPTFTRTFTPSPSPSRTRTPLPSATSTRTRSPSPTRTATVSPSRSPTATASPSPTFTSTPSLTRTPWGTLTFTSTSTCSPTPSFTPSPVPSTFSDTPTPLPAWGGAFSDQLVLAPVPVVSGRPLCLHFDGPPRSSRWTVYNVAGQVVAKLAFGNGPGQCWQTGQTAPGVYIVRVDVDYADGRTGGRWQKVAVVR